MRPITIIFGIFTVLLLSAFVPTNFSVPTSDPLTENDKAGLIKMREEEKLALEVYSYLDEMWDHHVFKNIKQSEARHGELLKGLLDQFSIKDPYIATKGQYADTQMQKLYQDLTTKGSKSLQDAFLVGATIEDLDIADLDELISVTSNKDILNVYENLNRGSRNHMRAFTKQLEKMDVVYTPVYIKKDKFSTIVNGTHEEGSECKQSTADRHSKSGNACGNTGGKSCAGKKSKNCCENSEQRGQCGKSSKKSCGAQ